MKNCPHAEKIARTLMRWQRICLCVFAHTILRCWLSIKMRKYEDYVYEKVYLYQKLRKRKYEKVWESCLYCKDKLSSIVVLSAREMVRYNNNNNTHGKLLTVHTWLLVTLRLLLLLLLFMLFHMREITFSTVDNDNIN